MSLPPLYKYLGVQGAKLTLANQCFRFAKPSEYDDLEDMTAQSLFKDKLEKALPMLSDGFVDAIMANLYAPPTCPPKQRALVTTLQTFFRAYPERAPIVKEGLRKDPKKSGMSLEFWKTQSDEFVKETNAFMQTYRVFCVTTDKASPRMWKEYAKDHQGIALRITPSVAKESKYLKFAPVTYQEKRPPIFAKTADFAAESLFGNQTERARRVLEGIIYAKTNAYKFESEYRLAIPLGEGEEDYRTQPFHPEEITELYLGAAMTDADKQEIIAAAKALNPQIAVFQSKQEKDGRISFDAV
ncbi:DUF2971 domain-containing protein [Bradyrhizobium sp. GCM10027634]|uniref:DUF2971 domain-containing protein n=1 Tax=unclassified Bradyrhizobium TaxID=2631580 RepID=UPI00263AEC77|nr:DUF2971 domain-containing protein [Bradyrhizobium sp. WYCCWR 12677]MDN5005548.1 DUF2971 domain-containing protein [Bradyrhizobium sp. WYCCWR 12677]